MLATATDVWLMAGYQVDDVALRKAQAIVEVYAGRPESLVTRPEDIQWLKYAVVWQVAYMNSDGNAVYEQANIERLAQNDTVIWLGSKPYAISPLAVKAVERLSWQRSRNISTTPWYASASYDEWETD